jgi:signal transduction histidine kinase
MTPQGDKTPSGGAPEILDILNDELAQTDHGVLLLTMELEGRVQESTAELAEVHEELRKSNSELLQLTIELENRVEERTAELVRANRALQVEVVQRKQAEQSLALHARRVQALLDLQALSYAPENQVLDFVLEACSSITQSPLSFIGVMDDAESAMIIHRLSQGGAENPAHEKSLDSDESPGALWAECLRLREAVIRNDYAAQRPRTRGLPSGPMEIRRLATVPILDGDHIVAVAAVANKECDYVETDVYALSTLLHKMWEILSRQRRARERETLEEQYRQAQKMEAVGQLAGGVAHDFNNILQAMVGYSSLLLDRLEARDETYEFAMEILRCADRASALTRQLLAFSRRQILETEDLDLNAVVHDFLKMLKRVIGEDIEVQILEGHRLGVVHADRGQIEQVLLNLCVNARDAMPEGGSLTIETENVVMDDAYCATHAWAAPGRYVLLSVADAGCGMDAKAQTRIFEPFYTTKELGKGTGLGLSTVYGIVRQHQGMIQVYSEVGKGTTFKMYLPSIERAASMVGTKIAAPIKGGTETILLAEDDEPLRKLAARILESVGYTVLLAADGEEAIELFRQRAAEVQLCVLDVVMPKLGGKAVYDTLRAQYPAVRFLFSSGYSTNAIHTGFVLNAGIELIQKPYAPDALLRKVREILDRPGTQ